MQGQLNAIVLNDLTLMEIDDEERDDLKKERAMRIFYRCTWLLMHG